MHDIINTILCVLFASLLTAQIAPIHDTLVCDHLVLPDIAGSNLSSNTAYFDQSNGEGIQYDSGDTIFSSTQLFSYDPVNEFEECFHVTVFGQDAAIDMPDTLEGCGNLTLPIIEGQSLSIQAAYFSRPRGLGRRYFAGNKVYESQKIYIYDGFGKCNVQDSLYLHVPEKPIIWPWGLNDTIGCKAFQLPQFEGVNIPASASYKNIENSNIYPAGDYVSKTGFYEMIADTGACMITDTVNINIVDHVYIEAIDDITVCHDHEAKLELDSIEMSRVNLFLNGKAVSPFAKTTSLKEGRNYLMDSIPESGCIARSFFHVKKLRNRENLEHKVLDTLITCNNRKIDLKKLLELYEIYDPYTIQALGDAIIKTNGKYFYPTVAEPDSVYSFLLRTENHVECIPHYDSLMVYVKVIDDCDKEKELRYKFNCFGLFSVERIIEGFPYGGYLYNPSTDIIYQNPGDQVTHFGSDTLRLFYIFARSGQINDTTTIIIPPLSYIEVQPTVGDTISSLCFKDTFSIGLNVHMGDSIVLRNIKIYEDPQLSPFITEYFSEINKFEVVYTDTFSNIILEDWPPPAEFIYPNSNAYVVFHPSNSAPYGRVVLQLVGGGHCYRNLIPDTVHFRTLSNTTSIFQSKLCPSEYFVVEQDTFDINNPKGGVVLENAAANGCDSFVNVDLDFYKDAYLERTIYFCDSSDYIYLACERFDIDNPSGRVTYEGSSVSGCDSVVDVELIYQGTEREYREVTICPEASFELNGQLYDAGSIAIDTLENGVGCDSVYVYYDIQAIAIIGTPSLAFRYDCDRQNYELSLNGNYRQVIWQDGSTGNNFQTDDEIINYTIIDTNGCEINMTQELSYPRWNIEGQTVFYAKRDTNIQLKLDTSGILNALDWSPASNLDCPSCLNPEISADTTTRFFLNFKDAKGCPQQLLIFVIFPQEEEIDLQMCRGDSLFFNGEWYTKPGNYQSKAYSRLGHDSVYFELSIEYYENTPILIEGDTALCPDDTIHLEVVSDHGTLRLDGQIVNREFDIFQPGQYRISGLDMNNCKSSETFTIGSLASPVVKTEDLLDIHYSDGIPLPVEYEGDIIDYQWHPAEYLNCEDCPYPRLIDRTNGTFHISIKGHNGCTAENAVIVRFLDTRYYIPNLIPLRPNVPENGIFYVRGDFDTRYDLQVYNRWGELVYEDRGLHMNNEEGWKPDSGVPVGVYTYRIMIYDLNENIVVYGDVTVK